MLNKIEVILEYFANTKKVTRKNNEKIKVSPCLESALKEIKQYLKNAYKLESGLLIFLNNINISALTINTNCISLKEDDVFKILMVISGG